MFYDKIIIIKLIMLDKDKGHISIGFIRFNNIFLHLLPYE